MNLLREEFMPSIGASSEYRAHFSWQVAVYAILVAVAIYHLCVP
jgi:hypothetical protein